MAKNPSGPEMLLPPATASYLNLFVPKRVTEKDDPKYSMVAIWGPADVPKLQEVKQECAKLLLAKFGPDWLDRVKAAQLVWPFKKINGLRVKPGYPDGGEFVNFNCRVDTQPPVYDRYKDPTTGKARLITDPAFVYAGCQVILLVRPYVYDRDVKKGVSLGLQGVQFWADGPRLDGRVDPIEKFVVEDAPVAAMPANGTEDPLAAMLGIADTGIGGLP